MFGTGNQFKVARIRGIPIYVSSSWFIVAALVLFAQYTNYSRQVEPAEAMQLAAVVFVLFFGGVLLHEAAHAIAARSFGLPVRAITLVFWGGATETRSWRKGAVADFVVAASGPVTTALLGVMFYAIASRMPHGELRGVMSYLGYINLLFAAFNAIPGFPLDGGRMLMAIAWGVTRNRVLAFRVAGIGSLLIGGGLIAYAVLSFSTGNGGAIFFGYIGFVIASVGRQIPKRAILRGQLSRGTAAEAMRPVAALIPADMSILDATEQWLRPFPDRIFPVGRAGRVIGTISLQDAGNVAASEPVHAGMVRLVDPPLIEAEEPLDDVVDWVGSREGLVASPTGATIGLIDVADIERWLQAHWATGEYREAPAPVAPPRPDA